MVWHHRHVSDRHSWFLISIKERSGPTHSLASSQVRKDHAVFAARTPGKREHHGPVAANDRHGTRPGSSLLSIRADTHLSDVEACRRRIIVDLVGSSRSDVPPSVPRQNESLESGTVDGIQSRLPFQLSSRFPLRRLRIPRPSRNRVHGAGYSVVKVLGSKASHRVISRNRQCVHLI